MNQCRKTPRANFLDYNDGYYFITICTRDKCHYFGEIYDNQMHYSEIGAYCDAQLANADSFNKYVKMLVYTIMPNHIHAIVRVQSDEGMAGNVEQRSPNPYYRANPDSQRYVSALSRYVSSFKGAVTKYAKSKNIVFGWQNRFHDHYIRGLHDESKIYEYIINNVFNWDGDCFRNSQST